MPKPLLVQVCSMDAELEFSILPSTTGRQLFDQATKTLGIRETWYFGLSLLDSEGHRIWIKYSKRVVQQINKYSHKSGKEDKSLQIQHSTSPALKKQHFAKLMLHVKFFPEDVANELIQEITLRLFYLQVKDSILDSEISCSPEIAVLLASYAAQVKHGDYDNTKDYNQFMKVEQWLPGRIIMENKLTLSQWEERIIDWYAEHRSMLKEDAMMEYLKIAQDLDMFGVSRFEVKNKNGTTLTLGVDALGINIYDKDKFNPRLGFTWSEIRNLGSHRKKFIIKPVDKKSPDFVLFSPSKRINKQILLLAAGNHQLHKRRQQVEPVEINQMRLYAKAERDAKLAERQALYMEKMQRIEAERSRTELEGKLSRYQSRYHLAIQELEKTRSSLHLSQAEKVDEDLEDTEAERERTALRERIELMKKEIGERRKILKMILESASHSTTRETIGNRLSVYSEILPHRDEEEIDGDGDGHIDYDSIHARMEALSLELFNNKTKTQEIRKDILKAKKRHSTVDILDKHHLLKYFSEEKDH